MSRIARYSMGASRLLSRLLIPSGLVRLLGGRQVVALTEAEAVIEVSARSRQAYRRKLAGVAAANKLDVR